MITHKHGKRVVKHVTTTFTYGTASVKSTGTGTFKLVIGLSARAAKELKLLGRRQVTIAVTFTPTGGTAHRESKKVTVIRSRTGKYTEPRPLTVGLRDRRSRRYSRAPHGSR